MSEPTQKHFRIVERILTRLKLKQLRLLVAVERHSSILHAARELNLSQPAATKLIKDLEADFGVMLFERTNRGVVPTIYGEALARHGKLIFAQISHAAQELDDLAEGSSGRIVIGTLLAASSLLLPRTITRVLAEKPNLSIKIQEGTNEVLMPALRSGELDLVVGRLPTHRHRDELLQERLYEEKVIAVTGVNHPLVSRKRVGFADMMEYGWIPAAAGNHLAPADRPGLSRPRPVLADQRGGIRFLPCQSQPARQFDDDRHAAEPCRRPGHRRRHPRPPALGCADPHRARRCLLSQGQGPDARRQLFPRAVAPGRGKLLKLPARPDRPPGYLIRMVDRIGAQLSSSSTSATAARKG